jgi:ribosomal protein S18 acetylase RimI-like enzyme
MQTEMKIIYQEKPNWETIGGGIHRYNTQQVGESNEQNLCFTLQGPDKEIVGGLIGSTFWGWFYISLMWIKEEYRGQGLGRRLLEAAEAEARNRGVRHAYLDTFTFQAPGFYEKLGYQVFGELKEFPPGHSRFFLTKDL